MLIKSRERPLAVGAAAAAGAATLLWLARRRRSSDGVDLAATGFDAYLKNASIGRPQIPAPVYASTSFEAYLRKPAAGPAAASSAAAASDTHGPPQDAVPVTVLFGTEYGFSKEVAERACEALRCAAPPPGRGAYWPQLLDMAGLPSGLPGLPSHQALLLVCSTQGDGVPPTEAREFCDWLSGPEAPQLGGSVAFSVCALGDK